MPAYITVPTYPWLSAYQPIEFGLNDPAHAFNWSYTGVTSVNGKAQFTASGFNVFGTPPCKLLYITSGTYQGIHVVTKIQDNGDILTDTDYISSTSGSNGRLLINMVYRIYYGYGTLDKYVEVKPVWNTETGSLVQNLSKFLQSIFTIQPPTPGMDLAMFKHFRVQIRGAQDFNDYFLETYAIDDTQFIFDSLWDFEDDSDPDDRHIWYLCNGTLPHNELNSEHLGNSDVLAPEEPITFINQCIIFSKVRYSADVIEDNYIYNVMYCNGTASETGIGFMEIEDDFIVS